jgi:hypothetical protein
VEKDLEMRAKSVRNRKKLNVFRSNTPAAPATRGLLLSAALSLARPGPSAGGEQVDRNTVSNILDFWRT